MHVQRHAPGHFCWIDLATSDAEGAKRFYTELFGWTAEDMPAGEGMTYTMLSLRGETVAALYQLPPEMKAQGIPPHWDVYVSVANLEESLQRVQAQGGNVVADPTDVFEAGRMAMAQDPEGAVFALWQPDAHVGSHLVGEPGAFAWMELETRDAARAKVFYGEVFGWAAQTEAMGPVEYTQFKKGEQAVGGMMQMTAEWGDMPSHWMTYLQVADVAQSAAKAKELGGQLMVEPTAIPGVGRFALIADPQGAIFSIIEMAA